jgi:hypothetical protein
MSPHVVLIVVALQYPYVIAFEPTFVEVHHVETGHLVQIIPGHNIRCLFADTPPSTINAPLPPGRPMYPSNQSYRPPGPGYPGAGAGQPGFRPPPGQGQGQGQGYGMLLPPPLMRGAPGQGHMAQRTQIVFTSEDGHVQFLRFPTPGGGGQGQGQGQGQGPQGYPGKAVSIHGQRPSR